NQNQKCGYHINSRHQNHNPNYHYNIKVEKIEPFKNGGVFIANGLRVQRAFGFVVNRVSYWDYFVEIIHKNLKSTNLIFFPFVQSLDVANVRNNKLFIKLLKPAVINTNNIKTTTSRGFGNFIVQEKSGHFIAQFQLEPVRQIFRNEN